MSSGGFNTAEVRSVDDFASDRALADLAQYQRDVLETVIGLAIPRFEHADDPALTGSGGMSLVRVDARNPLPAPSKPSDVDLIIGNRAAMTYLEDTFGWDRVHLLSSNESVLAKIKSRPGLPLPVDVLSSSNPARTQSMVGYDSDTPPVHLEKLQLTLVSHLLTAYRKARMPVSKGPASLIRAHATGYHTEDHEVTDDRTWQYIVGVAMARLIAGVPEELSLLPWKRGSNYPEWLGRLVSGGFRTHPAFKDIEPITIDEVD